MRANCNPCRCCDRILTSTSVIVSDDHKSVRIAVCLDGPLHEETKYCIILAQPCPVSGYHLPVDVVVSFTDGNKPHVTVPLKRLATLCNLEFGEDLPKCRERFPVYHTNGGDFIDIRKNEHLHYCRAY